MQTSSSTTTTSMKARIIKIRARVVDIMYNYSPVGLAYVGLMQDLLNLVLSQGTGDPETSTGFCPKTLIPITFRRQGLFVEMEIRNLPCPEVSEFLKIHGPLVERKKAA